MSNKEVSDQQIQKRFTRGVMLWYESERKENFRGRTN